MNKLLQIVFLFYFSWLSAFSVAGAEQNTSAVSAGDLVKISITRQQTILLTPQKETFMAMFDGNMESVWFPGWEAVYPASALSDLNGTYTIKKIRFRNFQGSRQFKVYGGLDPVHLPLITDQQLSLYNQWSEVNIDVADVKFLKFEITTNKYDSPAELEIWGIKTAEADVNPDGTGTFRATENVNGIVGANGFHWVNTSLETPFNGLREFLDAEMVQTQKDKYKFNPTYTGAGMLDDHYAELKKQGFEVLPVIQGNLPWTRTETYNNKNFKPVFPLDADPAIPASYKDYAAFLFQFAARYGSAKVDTSLLKIDSKPRWTGDPIQTKKSGLNLVRYIECLNEPDKNWDGPNGYMSPFELAAFLSAAVDGHCNTMGPGVGIKNADPSMKVVMGGLTQLSLDYIKAMTIWFRSNRKDKSVPIDVFNFHFYPNTNGQQHQAGSVGIAPEPSQLKEKLVEIKSYVDTYHPGKELYLSEYGYDSNTGSPQRCIPIGSMGLREVQAIWNVRLMLDLMATQIDKSYMYMMYDEAATDDNASTFGNCGVVTGYSAGSEKKQAWYYINTMRELLKDYKFIASESESSTMRKYRFSNGHSTIYVIWLTSSSDAKLNYNFKLPGITDLELIQLEHQNPTGKRTFRTLNGSVNLEISERPLFILINDDVVTASGKKHIERAIEITANPNPVTENLILNFNMNLSNAGIDFTDVWGSPVTERISVTGSSLNLSDIVQKLVPGVYFVRLFTESENSRVIRIIKQ